MDEFSKALFVISTMGKEFSSHTTTRPTATIFADMQPPLDVRFAKKPERLSDDSSYKFRTNRGGRYKQINIATSRQKLEDDELKAQLGDKRAQRRIRDYDRAKEAEDRRAEGL